MKSITAGELADRLGARLVGDGSLELVDVAKIEEAGANEITFVANPAYRKHLQHTGAGAVLLNEPSEAYEGTSLLVEDPYRSFLQALSYFHPEPEKPAAGVHPSSVVAEDAVIGAGVVIGPLCVVESGAVIGEGTQLRSHVFVGRKARIGADCLIQSRVSVREECELGDRVVVQDGAVIGSDGFGFAPGEEGYLKIPQVGRVILEDDVEIGANTTIDRATLGQTAVRRGSKLDNLIQIAHNVEVGPHTVMAAQTGIAGSTKIGARCMFGGQVGISGHLRLSDGVKVAASSGVHKDPGPEGVIGGSPARNIREWQRIEAALARLPELLKRVRKLEREE